MSQQVVRWLNLILLAAAPISLEVPFQLMMFMNCTVFIFVKKMSNIFFNRTKLHTLYSVSMGLTAWLWVPIKIDNYLPLVPNNLVLLRSLYPSKHLTCCGWSSVTCLVHKVMSNQNAQWVSLSQPGELVVAQADEFDDGELGWGGMIGDGSWQSLSS